MSTFPQLPKRGHRARFGKEARVPMPTSTVTPANLARVNGWKARLQTSRGLVLDRVIEHAHTTKLFSPSTRK
jgi:hypothetical protein